MSLRVQSGVRSSAKLSSQTSKLPYSTAKERADSSFKDDFMRYQNGKRCRPAHDLGAGLAGGAGVGAVGGAVVCGLALGVPLLPVFGIGVVTGLLGGVLGGAVGGVAGGVVGGVGGGITAASHAHLHAPEPRKLRKHVFSNFGVVPMRHQSARIVRHLQEGGVLSENGARAVRHVNRVGNALRNVRVFGEPLTSEQTNSIKQIVQLQASHA